MKCLSVAFVASVIASAALAQAPTPTPVSQKFVPFVVEEQDARQLRAFLDEQPMKLGLPILQWMEGLEQKALAKEAAAKAAAESEKAKENGSGGSGVEKKK